jgi:hypothetical protein
MEDITLDQATKQRACLEYCPQKGSCLYYAFEQDKCPKIKDLTKAFISYFAGKLALKM